MSDNVALILPILYKYIYPRASVKKFGIGISLDLVGKTYPSKNHPKAAPHACSFMLTFNGKFRLISIYTTASGTVSLPIVIACSYFLQWVLENVAPCICRNHMHK